MKRELNILKMKTGVVILLATALAAAAILDSCKETPEDNPVVYIIRGPNAVFQSETADYEVVIPYPQEGTTWSWTVEGATLGTVSQDTRTASVSFPVLPPDNTAVIKVSETMASGTKGNDREFEVTVTNFCVFDVNNFTGTFSCEEDGYGVYQVTFTKDPVQARTIINNNFWDFAAPGSVLKYTFSGDFDETVTVPRQTFTFADDVTGWVEGEGTYDGCSHTMTVDYTVYYDDEYKVHQEFSPGTKSANTTVTLRKGPEYFKTIKH